MARSLYLASLEPRAGRSVVTLGMLSLLSRHIDGVGYYRPVVPASEGPDARIELVRGCFPITDDEQLFAYRETEVADLLAHGRTDEVFKTILERARALEERHPFVVYDGTDYTGTAAALEFEFNAQVANHLGAPVLAAVNGADRGPDDVVEALALARESLLNEGCTIAALIVNRVNPDDLAVVRERIAEEDRTEPVWVLPEVPVLRMPTIAEIATALDAEVLQGEHAALDREVTTIKVAAMSLPNMLDHIVEGGLLVVAGDRPAMVLGGLLSRLSTTLPNIGAMILTGGFEQHPNVLRLLEGLTDVPVPVLRVDSDTYTTANEISRVRAVIRPESTRKVETALATFEEHVDLDALERRVEVTRSDRVTPLMFEYDLVQRARSDRKHIVLPEGTDERILRAAQNLRRRDVVDLTLLGAEADVRAKADALGLELGDVEIVDPATSSLRSEFAGVYHELRSHRGITREFAEETMHDVSYFGTMMVHQGRADGMVSGAAHTTQHTIRPAFEVIRTTPDVSIVSSVFLMLLQDRVLVYGDCAVNPEPDAEGLADIAISSARTAEDFGIEPRVAMLSYSTGESGKGRAVDRVREATALVRERRPDLDVDGPLQYDAAVDVSVGKAKLPGSSVAGRATVFIFPDLNTGNNTYKAVQRSSGAVAIGPVLQGLNKPVNDLSRGCLVDDVVNTVMITAVQAQG